MRAHQQWLAIQNHINSAVLHIPPLFLSSFLCKLVTQLSPRTFLSLFVSYILSNSNSSFSSSFFLLWQKSSSLNWLLLVPMATTLPLHPPSSLTPTNHSLKFTHPNLNPWLSFLLNWSTADLNFPLKNIKFSLIVLWLFKLLTSKFISLC